MSYHQRTLPHNYPPDATLFLTWRLFGSLPRERRFEGVGSSPGEAFARVDRLVDAAANGPVWLSDKRIAELVAETLKQGEAEYRLYELFAWVIMSNHVHGDSAKSAITYRDEVAERLNCSFG